MGQIEEYCMHLVHHIADSLDLGARARANDVVEHGFRKYYLRLETQTRSLPIDKYYISLRYTKQDVPTGQ